MPSGRYCNVIDKSGSTPDTFWEWFRALGQRLSSTTPSP